MAGRYAYLFAFAAEKYIENKTSLKTNFGLN